MYVTLFRWCYMYYKFERKKNQTFDIADASFEGH